MYASGTVRGRRSWGLLLGLIGICLAGPARVQAVDAASAGAVRAPSPAASVYGTDDRQRVTNTKAFPWSAVGLVQVHVGFDTYVGTAAMIGKHLALTCGHVVDGSETGKVSSVEVIPGELNGGEPFGTATVTQIILAPQWAAYADDGYDLALLVLDSDVGEKTGYFQIAIQPDSFFDNAALTSAGYPTDKGSLNPYSVVGQSTGMKGNVIYHDLDSEPGQSGSPIWYGGNDNTARLVGALEGSYITALGVRGIGARIDQQTANWIEEQSAKYADISQGVGGTVPPIDPLGSGSLCGLGAMQGVLGASLAWTVCLVSRRRGRPQK